MPVRERRNQSSHPCYTKPDAGAATGSRINLVLGFTRLTAAKTSFFLYVLLGIFSRYVVGQDVDARENAGTQRNQLMKDTCLKQGIDAPGARASDRGAPDAH